MVFNGYLAIAFSVFNHFSCWLKTPESTVKTLDVRAYVSLQTSVSSLVVFGSENFYGNVDFMKPL